MTQIDVGKEYSTVQTGSLVETNNGIFFLSTSAGNLSLNEKEYMAISYSSPIGQALFNRKKNDEFDFRGKKFIIKSLI